MPISLSDDHARLLRQSAQRLTVQQRASVPGVADLVQTVCAIQAQDALAATLAVRVRSAGLVAADVAHARIQERSIIRTWGPRGTLHLLATQDLGWLLPLLGPIFVAGNRRRYAELGLDEHTCALGVRAIRDALARSGPLPRAELARQLASRGIHTEGQATIHLIGRAALEGVICLGPDLGAKPTYVLLDDWIERRHPLPQEVAYAELARRYFDAYSPATPEDLAAWSGISMSKMRAAWQHIAEQLVEVTIAGSPAWIPRTWSAWLDELPAYTPSVRLLPGFDIYLLGYRDRDLVVPRQHTKRINAGGGLLHPVLLVDGRVVGTWKSRRQKHQLEVVVEPFDELVPEMYAGLEAEVSDLARFLGVQTSLRVLPPL